MNPDFKIPSFGQIESDGNFLPSRFTHLKWSIQSHLADILLSLHDRIKVQPDESTTNYQFRVYIESAKPHQKLKRVGVVANYLNTDKSKAIELTDFVKNVIDGEIK